MGRERHFKAFDLSEDGLAIIHSGFLARQTLQAIADRVGKETGEAILIQALGRYRKWWTSEARPAQQAAEMAREVAAALKGNPAEDVRRIIEQKIEQLYLLQLRHLEAKDPLDVAYLALAGRKVAVKEREVELTARKIAALEARVEALTAQARKAKEAVDRAVAKKSLRPEDLKEIRERVYGIAG